MLRFGEIVDVKSEPGIYFKAPFAFFDADTVQIIENRLLRFDLDNIRVQVSGGKFYEVDAFLVYKISDPRRFRAAVSGQVSLAEQRLRTRLDAALRRVYGLRGFESALSEDRADMMREVRDQLQAGRQLARRRDRRRAHPPHRPDGGSFAADLRPHEGRTSGRSREAAGARPRGGARHPRQGRPRGRRDHRRGAEGSRRSCAARAKPSATRPSRQRSRRTPTSSSSTAR